MSQFNQVIVRMTMALEAEVKRVLAVAGWEEVRYSYMKGEEFGQAGVIPGETTVYILHRGSVVAEVPGLSDVRELPVPSWLVAGCYSCQQQGELLSTACLATEYEVLIRKEIETILQKI